MVVPCHLERHSFDPPVLREYLVCRVHALLTDLSFRVRPALEDLYRSFGPLERGTRDETPVYCGDFSETVSTPERAQHRVFRASKPLP